MCLFCSFSVGGGGGTPRVVEVTRLKAWDRSTPREGFLQHGNRTRLSTGADEGLSSDVTGVSLPELLGLSLQAFLE